MFSIVIFLLTSKYTNAIQGIPEQAEIPPAAAAPASGQAVNPPVQSSQPAVPSGGPNANPLDLFPQVVKSTRKFKFVLTCYSKC